MLNNQPIMASKHFHINLLSEGIYAVIHRDGGWAISNSGIIDLGDRTIIFDTFLTPQAATDLRLIAEALMDRSVSIVVNSHYHNDHIWGNQAFNHDTDIISTSKTRELISTSGVEEYNWYKDNANSKLKTLEADIRGLSGQNSIKPLDTFWLTYYQAIVASLPTLKVRLPNITFTERLALHGTKRSVELISFNGGHTGNDTILYLPSEEIAFMGDLLFVGVHPYLVDSTPGSIQPIINQIKSMKPSKLIPGHGQVGKPDDLSKMEDYILALENLVIHKLKAGDPLEEVENTEIPTPFKTWECPSFFRDNLRFYYQHHSNQENV
jgi:cyclase